MSEHIHDWLLVDRYDNKARKLGPIPIDMHDIHERVLHLILEGVEPRRISETWTCNCGEHKTNYRETPSPLAAFL
jgi:hypothetical protein